MSAAPTRLDDAVGLQCHAHCHMVCKIRPHLWHQAEGSTIKDATLSTQEINAIISRPGITPSPSPFLSVPRRRVTRVCPKLKLAVAGQRVVFSLAQIEVPSNDQPISAQARNKLTQTIPVFLPRAFDRSLEGNDMERLPSSNVASSVHHSSSIVKSLRSTSFGDNLPGDHVLCHHNADSLACLFQLALLRYLAMVNSVLRIPELEVLQI